MIDRNKHVESLLESAQFLKRKVGGPAHLASIDITASQWLVVAHIFRSEGCTTKDVALALHMTGSAVTQLVNALVAKGYVKRERDPEDGRAHRLVLSAKSKKGMATFKRRRIAMMLKMFDALSDREFAAYVSLNKKILENMRAAR